MNKQLIILVFAAFLAACTTKLATTTLSKTEQINYQISPVIKNGVPVLKISTTFLPEKDGLTKLYYKDQSWGEDSLYNLLSDMQILDVKAAITVERDSGWISVKHPKKLEKLTFQYLLHQDTPMPLSDQKVFRPIIQEDYFQIFAPKFFVVPKIKDKDAVLDVVLEWNDFPSDFIIHNSFASQERYQSINAIKLDDFQSAVFVGGDFRVHPIEIGGNKVYFAIRGDWQVFEDSTMLKIVTKTFVAQRNFWKDHTQSYYTLTMIPTVMKDGGYSYQGTGLTNSFAMAATNNQTLEVEGLVYLFNHELQHNWIGRVIRNENEEEQYWFSEGFVDYYTWKNIAVNNIHDLGEDFFIKEVNKCIRNLYSSPVKEAPNSAINYDNFWSSRDYEKLPYLRGAILAFYLDQKIQQAHNGQKGLDDLMLRIKEDALHKGQKMGHAYFLNIVEQYWKDDFPSFFEKHIIQGEWMDLSQLFSEIGLSYDREASVFDLGFSLSEDQESIVTIDTSSNAYKAGLRLNDQIGSRSIYFGRIEFPVELSVIRDGKEQAISYFPVKHIALPQIQLTAANRQLLFGEDFDWLLGDWLRSNDTAGKTTFEKWYKKSDQEYQGIGYTLEKQDTVFKENLRLVPLNNQWHLEVTGVNESPTYFVVTNRTATSFISENPDNEFPKIIKYDLVGDSLKAEVSAGEMMVSFVFGREKNKGE